MQLICPISLKIKTEITLPLQLYENADCIVVLDHFEISDPLWIKFKGSLEKSMLWMFVGGHFKANKYKIVISSKSTGAPQEQHLALQHEWHNLNYIFTLIQASPANINLLVAKDFMDGMVMWDGTTNYSLRNHLEFGKNELGRLNAIRIARPTRVSDQKLSFVEMFFRLTLQQGPTFLRGAFFVTILEALYIGNEKDELRYRFAMRLAKKRGLDLEKFKHLRKMYDNRSAVFHGGIGEFDEKTILFLESESAQAIEEYTLTPDAFKGDVLDTKLLV